MENMNTYYHCICSQNGQVEKKFIKSFQLKSFYRAETKKSANEAACLSHKTSTTPAALLVVSIDLFLINPPHRDFLVGLHIL